MSTDPLYKVIARRGQSVYLPGGTVSMMPSALSEDLCSLIAGQKRLAIVTTLRISKDGEILDSSFSESVISVKHRLSYLEADELIAAKADDALSQKLAQLNEVRAVLSQRRLATQLVMEEQNEHYYTLDEQLHIDTIECIARSVSRKLIEECMLLVNQHVAAFAVENKIQIPFTAHIGFKTERLDFLKTAVKKLYPESEEVLLNEVVTDPSCLQQLDNYVELIRYVQNHPVEGEAYKLFSKQLERSYYTLEASPHFGLGVAQYTTFTSPIRKLQDFTVHQQIKAFLRGQKQTLSAKLIEQLTEAQSRSKQSTRLVDQWLHCHYLAKQGDKVMTATVTHINSRALTLTINESGINGQIETRNIKGKCSFDPSLMKLSCEEQVFILNQQIEVKVGKIDFQNRQIQFKFA
jgi:VacB/RNase II family 3'-5' exoribonuclease